MSPLNQKHCITYASVQVQLPHLKISTLTTAYIGLIDHNIGKQTDTINNTIITMHIIMHIDESSMHIPDKFYVVI